MSRSEAGVAPIRSPRLRGVRDEALGCRRCDLWAGATQTVFGEGAAGAPLVLVGEQPGDREDREGAPFVGPAGRVLGEALDAAGIDRAQAYITNVVKHFRNERKGKRRIHKKPNAEQIAACRVWLDAELAIVRPRVLVCLGATATAALLGPSVRVTADRGRLLDAKPLAPHALVTAHPSAVLRMPDDASRRQARRDLADDLRVAAAAL